MANLSHRELKVLDQIVQNPSTSQRELARSSGVSLGLVNVILKKFVKIGYIKASSLNKRKFEYILTSDGFIEVAKRTYQYAVRTIQEYNQLHRQLQALLLELQQNGFTQFSIHGDGSLRELIETVFPVTLDSATVQLSDEPLNHPESIVLNVTEQPMEGNFVQVFQGKIVNVIERLAVREGMPS